jgi:ribosomal-protein-alanine N-acetyltransferase
LALEPICDHHAEALFAGLSAPEAYQFIPQDPPSMESLAARYQLLAHGASPDGREIWLNWALRRHASEYIGFVQATVQRDTRAALIAYQLFPGFWRQGYGREAVAAMLKYLIELLDIRAVSAFIDTRNLASRRLVENLGFKQIRRIKNADFFKGAASDEHEYRYDVPLSISASSL